MHEPNLKRIVFHSKQDMSAGNHLERAELILKSKVAKDDLDINDILERYHIKKYLDNGLYLKQWTSEEISAYKIKAEKYKIEIGNFFSKINSENIEKIYKTIPYNYIESFWEIVNNYKVHQRVSSNKLNEILGKEPILINNLLQFQGIVKHFDAALRKFLIDYEKSAEILLSIYEIKHDREIKKKILPNSLSVDDKENIILKYLDSDEPNLNYIGLIANAKHQNGFRLSPKTRLKAKQLNKKLIDKFFQNQKGLRYGVSVVFSEDAPSKVDVFMDDDHIANYCYSVQFIKENQETYRLFQNFRYLFDYIDEYGRITLLSKKSSLGVFERTLGLRSKNEYVGGTSFSLSEMTSQAQLAGYDKVLDDINVPLLNVLRDIYTLDFQTKYNFPDNARFSIPKAGHSAFEKIKILAPEFESSLKQFKLFVEDREIDFELLAISSMPLAIRDIPSLNESKYLYLNEINEKVGHYTRLLFSDQTLLAYVDPFKEKHYRSLFDLLANEEVGYKNYEEFSKPQINFLVESGLLELDKDSNIQMKNFYRIMILKDIYENEFGSFYHYSEAFQNEAKKMIVEKLIFAESSLFSKQEQSYFNYYLNKSEFTNSLDLRNSYLHGTQGKAENDEVHQSVYYMYLKLVVLAFLKIDDDLFIFNHMTKENV
ncbi:hypothetical protein [Maribacter sp. 2308TA10-17]|uniref:hypothetical protein n=1 Tax=Maribacter sp. 2308TA10-17 TaxID=3386276 RepID=UPI0039BC9B08